MKKKFLIKIFSIIFALGVVNGSIVLTKAEQAAQQQNVQQQEKKLSPEDEKKRNIKTIKEALKKFETFEEQMKKKVKEIFKNFKKEDYEAENYNLEVFKKDVSYFLIYTHKKTGAQVYFNLVLNKDKLKEYEKDELIFRTPTKNDKGTVHFLEHCIAIPTAKYFWEKLKCSGSDFNAITDLYSLKFSLRAGMFGLNEKLEKEYVEKLSKDLISPAVFEKGNETFETEKKRILNEIKDLKGGSFEKNELKDLDKIRDYDLGGKISYVEKTTLKDVKKAYEKYIHPSNCLLIKNVADLNLTTIKNYLNLWHENYFKHFEKKEVVGNKYELKNKEKFLNESSAKDSIIFKTRDRKTDKLQTFNYVASLNYSSEHFNLKKKQCFEFSIVPFKEELENFMKSLGYGKGLFIKDTVQFYGNKKELFKQEVLEENAKKVMEFVANKLKNLTEEDYFYSLNYGLTDYNEFMLKNLKIENTYLIADPARYLREEISSLVFKSFLETGKPVSERFFAINKNNEIESSAEMIEKYAKENIDVYSNFAKTKPEFVNVFEKNDKTLKQNYEKITDKYEKIPRVIPIKLKEKNPSRFVKDFACKLLCKYLNEELNIKKGLIYDDVYFLNEIENKFVGLFELNKDSVAPLEDYIFKNFNEIMKKINPKEKDLNEFKKQYRERFKSFKKQYEDYSKTERKLVKDIKNYIETGKVDEKSFLHRDKDLKIKDFFSFDVPSYLIETLITGFSTLFKDHEEDIYYFENKMSFREKYAEKFNEKATPEFAKEYLEKVFLPISKKVKQGFNLAEKKSKELDSIRFKDVNKLIKTAYLVEDKNEIEKVNKNIKKNRNRVDRLVEKLKKN